MAALNRALRLPARMQSLSQVVRSGDRIQHGLLLKQWGGIADKLEGSPEVGVNAIKLSVGTRVR